MAGAPTRSRTLGFIPAAARSDGRDDLQRVVLVLRRHLRSLARWHRLHRRYDRSAFARSGRLFKAEEVQQLLDLVGDFNSRPDSSAYAILTGGVEGTGLALTNSFALAQTWSVESNQDPAPAYEPSSRIDHVFVAGGAWTVPWWTVDTWVYGASGLHTSDHFAMATELQFEG